MQERFEARRPAPPPGGAFLREALAGLTAPHKTLPCKYFYDEQGTALFDRICLTPEYYPTRAEREILWRRRQEIAFRAGSGAALVDLGGCNPQKARILLGALAAPRAYVPVDVSEAALAAGAASVQEDFPELEVEPLAADFTRLDGLPPAALEAESALIFFAGSTIGNFVPAEARRLLARLGRLGHRVTLLVGVDLKKPRALIEAAYNDAAGITAAFNLNLLRRLNDELGADFALDRFVHRAHYDEDTGRVEMRLESRGPQTAHLGGVEVTFAAGESIHTETSQKYTRAEFQALARAAGLEPAASWSDLAGLFSLHFLEPRRDG